MILAPVQCANSLLQYANSLLQYANSLRTTYLSPPYNVLIVPVNVLMDLSRNTNGPLARGSRQDTYRGIN